MKDLKKKKKQKKTTRKAVKQVAPKDAESAIAAGTGCHVAGQGILMFDGSAKKVEDVEVGDLLMDLDSVPRKVVAFLPNVPSEPQWTVGNGRASEEKEKLEKLLAAVKFLYRLLEDVEQCAVVWKYNYDSYRGETQRTANKRKRLGVSVKSDEFGNKCFDFSKMKLVDERGRPQKEKERLTEKRVPNSSLG